ncbi:hypothetical protein [Marinovum algicola]|uniref:hypothetical protein n=1 Tax=Marinovum algicola TaxID=42444 RepID=UPI00352A1F9A
MPSKHETAILALQAALAPHAATILREYELPEFCPPAGLINIVPGNAEEVGTRLGTGVREWQRPVELECVVQEADAAARDSAIDAALVSAATFLMADRTLGGAIDYLVPGAPEESEAVPMPGAESLKGSVLSVTLFYETTENPMEY